MAMIITMTCKLLNVYLSNAKLYKLCNIEDNSFDDYFTINELKINIMSHNEIKCTDAYKLSLHT